MQHFIAYFPYLFMKDADEIDFGFAKVWNFDVKKDQYITDPVMKAKIEGLLAVLVNHHSPVRNIGIISIGGSNDFLPLADKDYEIVRIIRLILFICFISENNTLKSNPNTGHQMATSENFDVIFQNFLLEGDYISETTGEIITFSKMGFKASDTKFITPNFVSSSYRFTLDRELFGHLLKLKDKKPLVFKKILNAVEIFLQGYFNTPHLSRSARVLLQMSAFEILLNLPERQERAGFKKTIDDYTALPNDKKYESYWSKHERHPSKPKEFFTIKGIWAEEFYLLRNSIIHGDTPAPPKFLFRKQQKHTDIATLFFVLSIKKQIEKSIRGYNCDYEIKWDTWTDDISAPAPFVRTEFVYERSFRRMWTQMMAKSSKRKQV